MRRPTAQLINHAAALSRHIPNLLALLISRVRGQGLVEYGLILVLIMVVCVGILTVIGVNLSEVWYTSVVDNAAW